MLINATIVDQYEVVRMEEVKSLHLRTLFPFPKRKSRPQHPLLLGDQANSLIDMCEYKMQACWGSSIDEQNKGINSMNYSLDSLGTDLDIDYDFGTTKLVASEAQLFSGTKIYDREIQDFLRIHLEIKENLEKIIAIAKKHFPREEMELEILEDPEFESEPGKMLLLYIVTTLSPGEALKTLYIIDEEVFENLDIDPSLFNINLRFK